MKRLLLLSALLFSFLPLKAGEDWTKFPVGPFGGLNNRDNSFAINATQAQDLLNVEVTQGGKSVKKRRGYGIAWTLSQTTSPVHGVYDFFDANGNEVNLFFSDTKIYGSVGGAAATVLLSTGPNGATYQCTDSLGQAYCTNTSRTTLYKISGSTLTQIQTVSSTGTMVATAVTRLAMGGFSDTPSRIDFSAETDFTTWGTGSLGTSACQFTINAPGAKITHITYAFNRLMWFKDTSFGYILLGTQPNQSDWVVKTVAFDVGTNDNTSVYREGILYFRGKDGHIYTFDGNTYQRLSREISGTVNQAQTRSQNSWNQTTVADWNAGLITTTTWLNTTAYSGSVALTTTAAISDFVDNVSTNFASGFNISMDTSSIANFLSIKTSTNAVVILQSTTTPSISTWVAAKPSDLQDKYLTSGIYNSDGLKLSSATAYLSQVSGDTQITMSIYGDNGLGTGPAQSVFVSTAVPISTVPVCGSSITVFGSSSNVRFTFPQTNLPAGTTYWISLLASPSLNIHNIIWMFDSNSSSGIAKAVSDSTVTYSHVANFSLYGKRSVAPGAFISRTFDTTIDTFTWSWQWSTFSATGTLPSGSSVTYRMQYSNDASNWSNTTVVSTGTVPSVPVSRYVRYLSTFTTTDLSTSPVISSITISSTERMRPWGTFDSQVNNSPNITSWDAFVADVVTSSGGTHTFYIRTSTGVFYTTATVPAWVPVTNGGVTTATVNAYFQIRDLIQTGSYAFNPLLNSFVQNWFEGSASDKSYATYFDDKILFSAPIGTGTTTNNKELIYDMLNNTWLLWDLPANGFFVKANKLYFGSATSGYVFKYGDIDNDNGSAINSYWKSKDYFGTDPFTGQELANISLVGKEVNNSTVTVSYTINGSSTASFYFPLTSSKSFVGLNKNMPAGLNANSSFNIQVGNNAVDQPWEIFGIQVGLRNKSWVPGGP